MASLAYTQLMDRISGFVAGGRDLIRVHHDLLGYIREVLLDAIKNNGKTALLGTEMTTASLMRMSEILQKGESSIRTGLSERANFEIVLLKAAEESRSLEIDSLFKLLPPANRLIQMAKKKAWIAPTYSHDPSPNLSADLSPDLSPELSTQTSATTKGDSLVAEDSPS